MSWWKLLRAVRKNNYASAPPRNRRARPGLEWLEGRALPSCGQGSLTGAPDPDSGAHGDVRAADGDSPIVTPSDTIPAFGAHPTIVAAASGRWSDPDTWSLGRLPEAGDVVAIDAGVHIEYDVVSDAALDTLVIHAGSRLSFRTDIDTRLVVGNFLVREGGCLEVGTPDRPVAAHARAEIVIADRPLDPATDPRQYGTGLIVLGEVTMHGAVKQTSFARLAVEPRPGDQTLVLSQPPQGWQVGDRLALPPSGGPSMFFQPRDVEELVVAGIAGHVVTLAAPLQGIHEGARDGDGRLDFLGHVANLSRNVVIRSENPQGTRGHTIFLHHAHVDLRYVQFQDLGRTTGDALDNSQFEERGRLTHFGTNQIGRYAVHLHHLEGGPDTPGGSRFQLVGNVIDGGRKWGVAIHDSHHGLIGANIVSDVQTAGIVTEDGSESYNRFEGNFVLGVADGDGFWLNGMHNSLLGNVVARAGTGFYLPPNLDASQVFEVPTADGGTETLSWYRATFVEFTGNEAYAVGKGIYFDHRHGGAEQGGHLVKDLRVWSSYGNVSWGSAAAAYDTDGVIYDGLVSRGASVDVYGNARTEIRHADIQGADIGVRDNSQNGILVIQDSYLRNDTNVRIVLSPTAGAGPLPSGPIRTTILRNVRHAAPAGAPLVAIRLETTYFGDNSRVPVLGNIVEVYDHDGQAGDDFRVYFPQQRGDAIVPYEGDIADDPIFVKAAAPEPGLTNQQAWLRYGLAFAGAVAPDDATTRAGIAGLVSPMSGGLSITPPSSTGPAALPETRTNSGLTAPGTGKLATKRKLSIRDISESEFGQAAPIGPTGRSDAGSPWSGLVNAVVRRGMGPAGTMLALSFPLVGDDGQLPAAPGGQEQARKHEGHRWSAGGPSTLGIPDSLANWLDDLLRIEPFGPK